jgi:threonine dehydrogenase-like Zn-dependent dehydrogenase
VAVVGCGAIGLMVVALARAAGASPAVAIEPREHRRTAALAMGATVALAPAAKPTRVLRVVQMQSMTFTPTSQWSVVLRLQDRLDHGRTVVGTKAWPICLRPGMIVFRYDVPRCGW